MTRKIRSISINKFEQVHTICLSLCLVCTERHATFCLLRASAPNWWFYDSKMFDCHYCSRTLIAFASLLTSLSLNSCLFASFPSFANKIETFIGVWSCVCVCACACVGMMLMMTLNLTMLTRPRFMAWKRIHCYWYCRLRFLVYHSIRTKSKEVMHFS